MTTDQIQEEFTIIDKKYLGKISGKNIKEDLINMGFLDYDKLSDEEKNIFDELENETKEVEDSP